MSASILGKRTMAKCNIDIPQDKICKYSYMMCPTCDNESPRQRTRSESYEISCRRKSRNDIRTLTPRKYSQCCEYENFDYDCLNRDYHRFEQTRGLIRENLCELPTSYITNNCQMNVTQQQYAKVTPDFLVEQNKISSKDYENSYAVTDPPNSDILESMSESRPSRIKQNPSLQQQQQHSSAASLMNPSAMMMMEKSPPQSVFTRNERFLDVKTSPTFETGTFFDKHFDPKLVRQRYSRELEILREKLKDLHNHKYSPVKAAPVVPVKNYSDFGNEYSINEIKIIEDVNDSSKNNSNKILNDRERRFIRKGLENVKSAQKITVKTRSRLKCSKNSSKLPSGSSKLTSNSKLKLRPVKNFTNTKSLENDEEALRSPSPLSPTEGNKNIVEIHAPRPKYTKPKILSSGDAPMWPVRYSLFPNIPPYIKFSLHDDDPNNLPTGRRYLKWKLSTITPIVVRKTLLNTGFRLVRSEFTRVADDTEEPKSNDWSGTWGKHMKSAMFKTLKTSQKLNHFAGTFQLGRKDRLWKNVQRLMHRFGTKEFGIIPQTFVLPQDLKALKQSWECKDGSAGEKWIVKPPASARGVGIKVINKWSQLPKQSSLVVQKYVSDPYLINGSKFDLRLYVLVTSFNPLRVYLYPEGLVRFASVKYTDDDNDLKDRFMHLTNYSINKLSTQYTVNEDANSCQGHKWTLTKLWEYLDDRAVDTKALWANLKQLVIKTMISGESPITQLCNENLNSRYNCYELFGVDVLFDERLKPWLLEVNISPSLHSTSPLDLHVKGPLVQTLFNLAQFHLPPKVVRGGGESPPSTFDPRQYATTLTAKEANKHNYFMQVETRADYLADILESLTGDDVRHLTQAEDELVVKGQFERIFPTAHSYKYLDFLPVRYYNRLFDAWETLHEKNRELGIQRLKHLCAKKVHLKVAPPPPSVKNSLSTIPVTTQPATATAAKPAPVDEQLAEMHLPHQQQPLAK